MGERKLLWVENNPDYLAVRSEFLEEAGYQVFKAATISQAEQLLQDYHIHLIILDIRLENDDNELDKSGLDWAKKPIYAHIPKVVLTGYTSPGAMRIALRPAANGQNGLAVDFLDKNDEPEEMIMALDRAFNKHVALNWALTLQWEIPYTMEQLLHLIWAETSSALGTNLADELTDLFRKAFYHYDQVTISQVITLRPNRVLLAVHAFTTTGQEKIFAVACGHRNLIQQESENHHLFLPKEVDHQQTRQISLVEMVHLAAIVYELPGIDFAKAVLLTEYGRFAAAEKVSQTLEKLFTETLRPRYQHNQTINEGKKSKEIFLNWLDLTGQKASRSLTPSRLKNLYQAALTASLIQVNDFPFSFNLPALTQLPLFSGAIYWGLTYGNLHGNGILVDANGKGWLIDFSAVEDGPLIRDFVCLETWFKFEPGLTPDLSAWGVIEKALLQTIPQADQAILINMPQENARLFSLIRLIRQQAAMTIGEDRNGYLDARFLTMLSQLIPYSPTAGWYTRQQLTPFLYSLISAELISQHLRPAEIVETPVSFNIVVDETHEEVWINQARISLAPNEYQLIALLFRHANETCTYEMINTEIYHYPIGTQSKETIQPAIMRLRRKIEPNPDQPEYIVTVRGKGYRLEIPQADAAPS